MNDSLLKSDIFFFVATVALVIITILLAAGLLYILTILKTIKKISRTAQAGTETIVESITEAKDSLKRDGLASPFFTKVFRKFYKKRK